MVIFDCNGVLVDSEPIVSAVLAESLTRAGFPVKADTLARRYHGRRAADVFASLEATIDCAGFTLTAATTPRETPGLTLGMPVLAELPAHACKLIAARAAH